MSPFVSGILGAVTVLLVAGLVRRAVWHRRFRGSRRGRSWFLHRVFRRLGTRPDQEKVVAGEVHAVARELRELRDDAFALRAEVADLFASPALDAAAVSRALEGRLAKLESAKARLSEALARVHAVLDPPQRAELAALLRRGPHRFHHRPHAA